MFLELGRRAGGTARPARLSRIRFRTTRRSSPASLVTATSGTASLQSDGAIFTPQLGWMLLSKFLQSQGVLEATNWVFLGAKVSANGKTLVGTAIAAGVGLLPGLPRRPRPGLRLPGQGQQRRPCASASRTRWTSSSRRVQRSGSAPATRRSESQGAPASRGAAIIGGRQSV